MVEMNLSHNYRQIMEMCVCGLDGYDCMMGYFDDCPDSLQLKSFLRNEFLKTVNPYKTIQLSQQVSTDKSQLVKEESEFDDFIENLAGKFGNLTEHHYVAKKQTRFFKQLKENLQFGECYCVLQILQRHILSQSMMLPKDSIRIIHRQQYTLS